MQKGSTTSLIVLAVVVLAIGLIAVLTDIHRANYDAAAGAALYGTTTNQNTTTSTGSTVSTAKTSPKTIQKSPATKALVTTQTTTITTTTTSTAGARLCTANDLTGTASWQGAGGALSGSLIITNSSKTDCALSHDGYLQVLSSNQVLPVVQNSNASAGRYTILAANDSVTLSFLWSNWCDRSVGGIEPTVSGAKYVRLILASNGGYLKVPLIDSAGRAQMDTPWCDATSTNSTISIWM